MKRILIVPLAGLLCLALSATPQTQNVPIKSAVPDVAGALIPELEALATNGPIGNALPTSSLANLPLAARNVQGLFRTPGAMRNVANSYFAL
jgi:hypothetical protein